MKILVATPSRRRWEKIMNWTGHWLGDQDIFEWKVFVEPQEVWFYEKILPDNVEAINIGENDKGLWYSENFIVNYAIANKYDRVLKLDDDSHGFDMYPNNQSKIENLSRILTDCNEGFRLYPDVAAIRFVQKRIWLFDKANQQKFSHLNQQLWGTYYYNPRMMPELPEWSKWHTEIIFYLMLMEQGYQTMTYRNAGLNIYQNTGKGGLSSLRTDTGKDSERTVEKMMELFPKVKKVPHKDPKIRCTPDVSYYEKKYKVKL